MQLEEAFQAEGLFGSVVEFEEWSYPTFYVRFRTVSAQVRLLRFDATNYDFQPLDIEPVDPETRAQLDPVAWPRRGGSEFPTHPGMDDRPFLCIQATRSYYTHPSHLPNLTGDRWEMHRSQMRLGDLLRRIAEHFASGYWS
jgi:hypothetical protein